MKKTFLLITLLLLSFPLITFASDDVLELQGDKQSMEKDIGENENITIDEVIKVDENTTKVTNRYFDLTLERKPQSAFGKHIPYVLTIVPHLNSTETQILWNTPSTLEASPKHEEYVSLREGETYSFKANIKPLKSGTYDFSVSVISWQHDTNYTNSIDDSITLSRNLVLQPISDEYTTWNIVKVVGFLILFAALCYISIVLVKKYMIKAKRWLTPPV